MAVGRSPLATLEHPTIVRFALLAAGAGFVLRPTHPLAADTIPVALRLPFGRVVFVRLAPALLAHALAADLHPATLPAPALQRFGHRGPLVPDDRRTPIPAIGLQRRRYPMRHIHQVARWHPDRPRGPGCDVVVQLPPMLAACLPTVLVVRAIRVAKVHQENAVVAQHPLDLAVHFDQVAQVLLRVGLHAELTLDLVIPLLPVRRATHAHVEVLGRKSAQALPVVPDDDVPSCGRHALVLLVLVLMLGTGIDRSANARANVTASQGAARRQLSLESLAFAMLADQPLAGIEHQTLVNVAVAG